jgi:hypothetical protein
MTVPLTGTYEVVRAYPRRAVGGVGGNERG